MFDQIVNWLVVAAAVVILVDILRRTLPKKKANKAESVILNDQGMAIISEASVMATPISKSDQRNPRSFPEDLQGFIAELKPGEISTILLEMAVGEFTQRKKDVCRAVTIAAACFNFRIPFQLVCLDARTHLLYRALKNQMEMVAVKYDYRKQSSLSNGQPHGVIIEDNCAEPDQCYLECFAVAGLILMHYAAKGPYPSLRNFVRTFNRNVKGKREYSEREVRSLVTAYAGVTKQRLPANYILYCPLTDMIFNSRRREKIVEDLKPHLTLVK